jgi:hypothetical protein
MASLRRITRITAQVLGHGSCNCSPFTFASCSVISKPTASKPATPTIPLCFAATNIRQFHSSAAGKDEKKREHQSISRSLEGLSMKAKLKKLWKDYGVVAITTYFSIYGLTLASFFFLLDFNLIHSSTVGLDPAWAIEKVSDFLSRLAYCFYSLFSFLLLWKQ